MQNAGDLWPVGGIPTKDRTVGQLGTGKTSLWRLYDPRIYNGSVNMRPGNIAERRQ